MCKLQNVHSLMTSWINNFQFLFLHLFNLKFIFAPKNVAIFITKCYFNLCNLWKSTVSNRKISCSFPFFRFLKFCSFKFLQQNVYLTHVMLKCVHFLTTSLAVAKRHAAAQAFCQHCPGHCATRWKSQENAKRGHFTSQGMCFGRQKFTC